MTILASLAISVAMVGAVQAILPVLVIANSIGTATAGDAALLGPAFTVIGVGALVGGLTLGLAAGEPSLGASVGASILLGCSVLAAGLLEARELLLAALAVFGFLGSVSMALLNGSLQRATDDAFRARVMSLYVAVYAGATAIGSALGGLAAGMVRPQLALTAIGAVGICLGLLLATRDRAVDPVGRSEFRT